MKDCPFPTDFCPLCQAKLVNVDESSASYQCQNVIVDEEGSAYKCHYYVDVSDYKISSTGITYYQNAIVPPFIFYSHDVDNDTTIYWFDSSGPLDSILTLPRITDWSNPEKLVERVKKLIPFS